MIRYDRDLRTSFSAHTRSGDPRGIEQRRIVHLEVALDDRPLGLSGPVLGTEQVLGIDLELHALESGDADDRQEHGHYEEVPRVPGHHVSEPVERFCQPLVDTLYAASHGCRKKNKQKKIHKYKTVELVR